MGLIPVVLRPGFILRRNAMRKGLLGPSNLWKIVALVVFGRSTITRMFGRRPDVLGTRTIGVGHVVSVAVAAPLGRKQAKRAGITKSVLEAAARADLEAAQREP